MTIFRQQLVGTARSNVKCEASRWEAGCDLCENTAQWTGRNIHCLARTVGGGRSQGHRPAARNRIDCNCRWALDPSILDSCRFFFCFIRLSESAQQQSAANHFVLDPDCHHFVVGTRAIFPVCIRMDAS